MSFNPPHQIKITLLDRSEGKREGFGGVTCPLPWFLSEFYWDNARKKQHREGEALIKKKNSRNHTGVARPAICGTEELSVV